MAKASKIKTDTLSEYNKLLAALKSGQISPVYLLEGEEGYYIDRLLEFFENLLTPEEKDFNLITLYGKEVEFTDVVNACSRFPMFAEKTVVLLREAAQTRDLNGLVPYFKKPSPTTILVIDYRGKTATTKDKWLSPIKENGVVFNSANIVETQIPSWIQQYGAQQGYKVQMEQAEMLTAFLGNDLQKIANELEKVHINEPELKELTAELIEKHIGISREYNFLDLPKVILDNDKLRLARMLDYFVANPKKAPLPPLVASFYNSADKIYRCYAVPDDYNNPESRSLYYYRGYAKKFSLATTHQFIALVNEFAKRAVGVDVATKDDAEILKETVGKMNALLHPQG